MLRPVRQACSGRSGNKEDKKNAAGREGGELAGGLSVFLHPPALQGVHERFVGLVFLAHVTIKWASIRTLH